MSHSTVAVLLHRDVVDVSDDNAIQGLVAELLEPFDENISVDPYTEKCWCIGQEANRSAEQAASAMHGSIEDHRTKFHALKHEDGEDLDAKWREFIKPYVKFKSALFEQSSAKDLADPKCMDCDGTGERESHYNPKSKWDWYEVGGRWNGDWPKYRNLSNVTELANLEAEPTFAILTPDGVWQESGRMGWFGMVSEEKDKDTWAADVSVIADQYGEEYVAVVVDVHI